MAEMDTLLSQNQIPIIDVSFAKADVNQLAVELRNAFQTKGMALLVNHGVSEEKLKMAHSYFGDFCKLPEDIREIYLRKIETGNHGYVKPGQERFYGKTRDIRYVFNILSNGSKLPEEQLPGFRENISEIIEEFENLSQHLMQALAIGIGMPPKYFIEKHLHTLDGGIENETMLRILYYPPLSVNDDAKDDEDETHIQEKDVNTTVTRCGAHCDYGTFTLLTQDSEGGLEVQLPDSDKWHRVGHLPGAVFINTGEMLSMWTQGKYQAVPHRVVIPEKSVARSKGRYSIAYFLHADNSTPVLPIETCALSTDENGTKKKIFEDDKIYTAYEHCQMRFKQTYGS